jgi:outer membrane protein assembly factor BamB
LARISTGLAGVPAGRRAVSMARRAAALTAALLALTLAGSGPAVATGTSRASAGSTVDPWDWPANGHDAQHTFHARTTLTESSVSSLKQAWFFPTGDVVTAAPTVVDGTVYVGSWDDYFYAVNLATGTLRWKVRLDSQNGISPYPGEHPRDYSSDGGLVTSSAWFQPAGGGRPALVIFGGGYTLYALKASTGAMYWHHVYSGRPGKPDPNTDSTRIFSSPVVTDGKVFFGVDEDGQSHSAGYIVAASLQTGAPVWEFQTDVGRSGHVLDDTCGSIWSSGTVLPDLGLVVFGTADCDFEGTSRYADSVLALRIANGSLAWRFHPLGHAPACDDDFGASANAGFEAGRTVFLGEGSKDGTYYSLDPADGRRLWSTNVVFGGSSGGFVASTAYAGGNVYGATGLGDFNPTQNGGNHLCDPADSRDTETQNPTDHAFDAATGSILWQQSGAASFSPTTVAGGMTFNGPALAAKAIDVRNAANGDLLAHVMLPQYSWSGITVVGDAVIFGLGTTASPTSSGIEVLTPGGAPPKVPGERRRSDA